MTDGEPIEQTEFFKRFQETCEERYKDAEHEDDIRDAVHCMIECKVALYTLTIEYCENNRTRFEALTNNDNFRE
ncbi:unnamed protein product [Bursaphelenchus xylophilus]|uniref:(pine wood nematode) hypothetical protein n=1 Tax=Bursaphelenchus xylophilus TaxID=6326 RepID=A0A7I8XP84_BURXY|nr:unnamed protein product [Bursaphelenchus xylophilus]CAG9080933.1 unnamed protein product [Bursaphelenchus xylophilus]